MGDGFGHRGFSVLGAHLPPAFERRVVTIPAGSERAFDEREWRDAIVVVERGEVELECSGGSYRQFGRGDVLWLSGLPLRALRNRGREPAWLVAVSRRRRELPGGGVKAERRAGDERVLRLTRSHTRRVSVGA
jgi:hypothetical protein